MVSFILPGNSATGGYDVANSLRFNSGSSDSLTRSTTAGNRTTWTFSTWFKRSKLGVLQSILEHDDANYFRIRITSGDVFEVFDSNGNNTWNWHGVLRDTSSWYSIILRGDSTDGTNNNRLRLYINGTLASANTVASISQNYTFSFNQGGTLQIGKRGSTDYLDGYLAETILIDGSALAPDQFGEFDSDSGIWKPIDVSGLTFGDEGFYLDFDNSGALGADVSGNGNNFTVNNLTSVDQSTDTCTNNFATGNPIASQAGSAQSNSLLTFSEGNLLMADNSETGIANFGLSSGKWFWEVKVIADQDGLIIGACNEHFNINAELGYNSPASATGAKAFGYYGGNGTATVSVDDGSGFGSYGSAIAVNNIVSVALDLDSADQSCTFYLNGSSQGALDITNLSSGESYFPAVGNWSVSDVSTSWNFGSPQYSESGGNSDGNGYGNFSMAVPSGYYALNTKNLAEYG